ncbi:MAG: hypothetical protein ACRENJ_03320 [Candidatus Eiseniibacteriota bacterium]
MHRQAAAVELTVALAGGPWVGQSSIHRFHLDRLQSRAHRDRVNARIMKDPRIARMMGAESLPASPAKGAV